MKSMHGQIIDTDALPVFHSFISNRSPIEQSIWLTRGYRFVEHMCPCLGHLKNVYFRAKDRQKKINVLKTFFEQIRPYREQFNDVPVIPFKTTDSDKLVSALLALPSSFSDPLYLFLRTQPVGLLFIQEYVFELALTLQFSMLTPREIGSQE